MPPISMLIKPASGHCNMCCSYCFYSDEAHMRGVMSRETVTALLDNAFASASGSLSFAFQGGEPLLAGIDFFRFFVSEAEKRNLKRCVLNWSVQTNGTLLTRETAVFFAEKRFLSGLSLDGTSEIHNKYRCTAAGEETFSAVMRAAKLLSEAGADFNILTVATSAVCRQGEKVYAFYKKNGFGYLQFITCLESLSGIRHGCSPSDAEYGRFLCDTFRLWQRDWFSGSYVSVRLFDNLVQRALGYEPELCSARGNCSAQLVVEANGDCYPCDFYVDEQYKLGNICSDSISALASSSQGARFITDGALHSSECEACPHFFFCRGGCRRERGPSGKSVFCGAMKRFFGECTPGILSVADDIKRRNN